MRREAADALSAAQKSKRALSLGRRAGRPDSRLARSPLSFRAVQAEHIFHTVEAGRPINHPLGRAQGAECKSLPARSAVCQLEPFSAAGKNDLMVADDVAATQRMHRDVRARPACFI